MEAATPNNLATPKKLRKAVFSPLIEESPRKLSRSAMIENSLSYRENSFISNIGSPGNMRESFWNTLDISAVSQDTYMASYDPEVEQYEVDECTDADYFSRGLRSTPAKDSGKTPIRKSPFTLKSTKRSEREIFLEAQILELKRQLKQNQQSPVQILPDSTGPITCCLNEAIESSSSYFSDCSCEECILKMQNESLEKLMIACKTADLSGIVAELDRGVIPVNIQENDLGNSPLHFACSHDSKGEVRVAQLLLNSYGANKYLANDMGSTPLHYACLNGFLEIVQEFIWRQGMSPDLRDKEGKTPLFNAAFHGHLEVARLLLSCDENEGHRSCQPLCDVNARSRSDWTALHCACYSGHFQVTLPSPLPLSPPS